MDCTGCIWPWAEANQGLLNIVSAVIGLAALAFAIGVAIVENRRARADRARADRADRRAETAQSWAQYNHLRVFVAAVVEVINSVVVPLRLLGDALAHGRDPDELTADVVASAVHAAQTIEALRPSMPPHASAALTVQHALYRMRGCASRVLLGAGLSDFPTKVDFAAEDLEERTANLWDIVHSENALLRLVESEIEREEAVTPPPLPWWRRAWCRLRRSADRSTP